MDFLKLAHRLKEKVLKDRPENIAIIAIYGSYAWGKPTNLSDLDMYAIIDKNTPKVSENFIYNGRSVDLWSMTWNDACKMARNELKENPWCVGAYLFTGSNIIYSRSSKDLERFNKLKEETILGDESIIKGLQSLFKDLLFFTKRIEGFIPEDDLLTQRWVVWNYINTTVNIISLLNKRYLKSNWGSNIKELTENLKFYPEKYQEKIVLLSHSHDKRIIINTLNDLSRDIENLIQTKISFMKPDREEKLKERLAEEYIGIIEYVNKAKTACHEKNFIKVSYAITELQAWLNELVALIKLKERKNLTIFDHARDTNELYLNQYNLPDFVSSVSNKDFERISEDIRSFEKKIKEIFTSLNISVKEFQNREELTKYLD